MEDMLTTEYDGCGRCLVGVRRLSRKTDATSSPQRQGDQILRAAADVGGHIVAWADDWEVSGATDPLTRRGFRPWLRGEMGPYDGIAAATVDRVGRNVGHVEHAGSIDRSGSRYRYGRSRGGLGFQRPEPGKRMADKGVGVANGTAYDPKTQPRRSATRTGSRRAQTTPVVWVHVYPPRPNGKNRSHSDRSRSRTDYSGSGAANSVGRDGENHMCDRGGTSDTRRDSLPVRSARPTIWPSNEGQAMEGESSQVHLVQRGRSRISHAQFEAGDWP